MGIPGRETPARNVKENVQYHCEDVYSKCNVDGQNIEELLSDEDVEFEL